MLHRVGLEADQLIERGQRGRYLRAADQLAVPHREKRMRAARVGGVGEALLEACGVRVRLPPSSAPCLGRMTKDLGKAGDGELHLALGPRGVPAGDEVLPL